jgi:hypothetical protein
MTETTVITSIPADGAQEGVVQTAAVKEGTIQIPLKVTEERTSRLKLGVLRRVQKMGSENADFDALYDYIGHYMTDDAERYLSQGEYYAVLDELEIGQLNRLGELVQDVTQKTEDAVVPKA